MWSRTSSGLLYRFELGENGYQYLVTDLKSVFCECMSVSAIETRASLVECPFALSRPQQIENFGKTLAEELANTADIDLQAQKVNISATSSGIAWRWYFELHRLNVGESADILGSIASNLLTVVVQAADLVNSRNEVISKKDLVIEGLLESGKRGVEYKPPFFLKSSVDVAKFPSVNADELLRCYWQDEPDSDESTQ